MKNWLIRFATMLVFNIAVLLLIVLLVPGVRGAWGVLWGGVILTLATMWIKPLLTRMFTNHAQRKSARMSRLGLKSLNALFVFLVALIVWVLTVLLSQIHVSGFFFGWILPPVALLLGWFIYDAVDDKLEAQANRLYDSATGAARPEAPVTPTTPPVPTAPPRVLKDDGLTEEQRRMFDDLG